MSSRWHIRSTSFSTSNGFCRKSLAPVPAVRRSCPFDHAADADDFDVVQGRIAADPLADFLAVDIGKHDVEHDHVRMVFLDHHAGVEPLLATRTSKRPSDSSTSRISSTSSSSSSTIRALRCHFPGHRWNAVFLHELIEDVPRDTAKSRARDAEPFELSRIETANDGLLADLTDLGCFARRKDRFHDARPIPSILSTCVVNGDATASLGNPLDKRGSSLVAQAHPRSPLHDRPHPSGNRPSRELDRKAVSSVELWNPTAGGRLLRPRRTHLETSNSVHTTCLIDIV